MKCQKCGYELPEPPEGFGVARKKPIGIECVYCPKCGAMVKITSRGKKQFEEVNE